MPVAVVYEKSWVVVALMKGSVDDLGVLGFDLEMNRVGWDL